MILQNNSLDNLDLNFTPKYELAKFLLKESDELLILLCCTCSEDNLAFRVRQTSTVQQKARLIIG